MENMTQDFTPTPAKEWRNLHNVTLPSGRRVVLRKPDLFRLILKAKDGKIPNGLRSWALNKIMGKATAETWKPETEADVVGYVDMVEYMCEVCFAEPVITENPNYEAGEISVLDIDRDDREYVFKWAAPQGVGAAQAFPEQSTRNVDAASGVQPVREDSITIVGAD